MDWANQPDPFRRYEGAPLYELPLLAAGDDPVAPSYESLFFSQPVDPQSLSLNSLSRFFEYGLSITAWKEYGGNRWALRSNPSSGNLHPTEGYLLIRDTADLPLKPGLYHYAPKEHGLEHRCYGSNEVIEALLHPYPPQSFFVGLSSIHWREAWKYGERRVSLLPARRRPRAGHASDCGSRPRLACLSSCRARRPDDWRPSRLEPVA